jgi:hypothetical protein
MHNRIGLNIKSHSFPSTSNSLFIIILSVEKGSLNKPEERQQTNTYIQRVGNTQCESDIRFYD